MKKLFTVLGAGAVLVLIFFGLRGPQPDSEEIVSKNGLHYHPEISIIIKGEERPISANIGLVGTHSPVHTHDEDGIIHQEFEGTVVKDDLTVGRFFSVWGREFNSECIFEFCNGENGTVKMTVNGETNGEFENYIMSDGDKIEIKYE